MKPTPEVLNARPLLRPGIDHDPVAPWVWGTWGLQDPVEIVSFAVPAGADGRIDENATIMIRTKVGDPTSLREVLLKDVACFDRTRHQDWGRPKLYYDDGLTNFVFADESWLWR